MKHATVIKYKIGEEPPYVLDPEGLENEAPPQPQESYLNRKLNKEFKSSQKENKKVAKDEKPAVELENVEWTEPKYNFKYRSHVDLQDYCIDNLREGRSNTRAHDWRRARPAQALRPRRVSLPARHSITPLFFVAWTNDDERKVELELRQACHREESS